jgi:hypothetical protein
VKPELDTRTVQPRVPTALCVAGGVAEALPREPRMAPPNHHESARHICRMRELLSSSCSESRSPLFPKNYQLLTCRRPRRVPEVAPGLRSVASSSSRLPARDSRGNRRHMRRPMLHGLSCLVTQVRRVSKTDSSGTRQPPRQRSGVRDGANSPAVMVRHYPFAATTRRSDPRCSEARSQESDRGIPQHRRE